MSSSRLFTSAFLLCCTALVACGDPSASEDEVAASTEEALGGGHGKGQRNVHVTSAQAGGFIADITAEGDACPDGSWDASIAPDGQTFTITFSKFEVQVAPGARNASTECAIAIDLNSTKGISYSVGKLFYSGYVFLDSADMTARRVARYAFSGDPADRTRESNVLSGPIDQEYVWQDMTTNPDPVWSACGKGRKFKIHDRLDVKNNRTATGTGYANTLSLDGNLSLKVQLTSRPCQG